MINYNIANNFKWKRKTRTAEVNEINNIGGNNRERPAVLWMKSSQNGLQCLLKKVVENELWKLNE